MAARGKQLKSECVTSRIVRGSRRVPEFTIAAVSRTNIYTASNPQGTGCWWHGFESAGHDASLHSGIMVPDATVRLTSGTHGLALA